ncbi:hypothetical protein H0H87_009262 [Tephrocybe sp. NHM501043]|nr:hypothetical protein H0H87_009262 [Tephrocybe sp. NHM501043]
MGEVNIHALARSLVLRPERGCLIRKLFLTNFKDLWATSNFNSSDGLSPPVENHTSCTDDTIMGALGTILRLSTSIQHLSLTGLREPLSVDVLEMIALLTEVETLDVGSRRLEFVDNSEFMLGDIQRSVANWTKLHRFNASCWTNVETLHPIREVPVNLTLPQKSAEDGVRPDDMQCPLQCLELSFGTLNRAQLSWFSLAPKARLKQVTFTSVQGLSNNDLFHFLSEVSATLESLSIAESSFTRHDITELLAFDVVLPRMRMLAHAEVCGDIATASSIARQHPPIFEPVAGTRITIRNHLLQNDTLRALEKCSWNYVYLEAFPVEDNGLLERAKLIANERGITIGIWNCK